MENLTSTKQIPSSSPTPSPEPPTLSVVKSDAKALVRLALPSLCYTFLTMFLQTVDGLMIGRALGSQMASAAIGGALVFVTLSVPLLSTSGLDCLANTAIGAKSFSKVGAYLQQSLIVSLVLSLVPALCWTFSEKLLFFIGFTDTLLVERAGIYMRTQIFSIPFAVLFTVFGQKLLECQGIVWVQVICLAITNVINAITNYIFIFIMGWGFFGAALSTGLARIWPLIMICFYHRNRPYFKKVWVPWSKKNLKYAQFKIYLGISLPAMLFMCSEGLAFTIWSLIAGAIDEIAASAHAILLNSVSLSYSVCLGLAMASSIKVGHLMGAGEYKRAKKTAHTALLFSVAIMSLFGIFFFSLRKQIPRWFITDKEVIETATGLFVPAVAFQIVDGLQAVSAGVIRGIGKNMVASVVAILCYYGVSIPLSFYFSFTLGWGVQGLWYSIVIALTLAAFLFTCVGVFS
ncbi:hypothetical protein GEMRC1_006971 [Eukaryota sp. GEM-RC1]